MASSAISPNELFGVKGLVVVITGGGSGIGLMIAQSLEANGAIVYILGRRQDTLDTAAKTAQHGQLHGIQCDVSKKQDLESAASQIESKHGYVNVVIANSGILGPGLTGLPENPSLAEFRDGLWNQDYDAFNQTFAVNTTGVFFTVAAFLDLLDEGNKRCNLKQRSQVIATSSVGAYMRTSPLSSFAYDGSKAAVVHMMKIFTTRFAPYGIRANTIVPGWYPSEMTTEVIEHQDKVGWAKDFVPEERAGDQEDLAGAVLFLVSRAGAYINGNVLVTDGGRLGVLPGTY
ncbi:hypothetical protein PFICI_01256 [Pestalotiopsis fici W106-1]|uniref:Uncharacterized protein n=1 Tax=Pestalotiopsis fici (strain W106-1 / CGMCC3.15140) TaxID=1229662 RepID=W3XN03_PESFW|nr:uncharacterized protein PFICI_01256 [Pestalotiopsis fici W106-1]ETS87428.1 hypothetical protein PFICI_01256 [Pestalotiopsis fici W106-1]